MLLQQRRIALGRVGPLGQHHSAYGRCMPAFGTVRAARPTPVTVRVHACANYGDDDKHPAANKTPKGEHLSIWGVPIPMRAIPNKYHCIRDIFPGALTHALCAGVPSSEPATTSRRTKSTKRQASAKQSSMVAPETQPADALPAQGEHSSDVNLHVALAADGHTPAHLNCRQAQPGQDQTAGASYGGCDWCNKLHSMQK